MTYSNKLLKNQPDTHIRLGTLIITYPNIVLPGGITWGATADQITAAYGTDPADLESTYGNLDTDGYIVYNYYNDYKYKMRLHVDKEKGLCEIRYEVY